MSLRFSDVIFIISILLSTGCASNMLEETVITPSPLISTSTLTATLPAAPSDTPPPLSPLAQPTIVPVEGMTSTQVNVRAEPSTASNVLGILLPNTKVEITGKDPGENWWQINYPLGVNGKGWVTAQYITTTTKPEVPTIDGGEIDTSNGNFAIIQQQINVRSGPGTGFNSLGTLNPQDIVVLIGKDANGVWLQINFDSGPEGKGWVNAAFVQAQGVENLPIITETGLIVGTGTPTSIPLTPTPTIVPAWNDHDSPSNPIVSVFFEPAGTQTVIYNGDLSSPDGDSEDWIAFKPNSSFVFASLECKGSNSIGVELTANNLPVSLKLACGDQMKQMATKAGFNYLIHLRALSTSGNLQYTNYILTIKMGPS